jgi:hypothetical protein
MKPKTLLFLALVLCGALVGCSSIHPPTGTRVFDYSSEYGGHALVLKGLGQRLSVRVEADSWQALIEKVKPAFAWNGCDMMWITEDTNGRPQFVLDEAYIYQPTNEAPRWVLLEEHEAPFDPWYGEVMGHNLRGIATLHEAVPVPHNDAGIIGEYEVVKSVNPRFGTVYEIGWQKLMANGTCLCEENRRLYVLEDRANQWRFLGEGIAEGNDKSHYLPGFTSVESRVVWTNSKTHDLPVEIRIIVKDTTMEVAGEGDANSTPRPDWTTCREYVLGGPFPAAMRRTTERPYLLTEKGDTFDKIVLRSAQWCSEWGDDSNAPTVKAHREEVLKMWRTDLARLNPQLPETGNIKEGTRVQIP